MPACALYPARVAHTNASNLSRRAGIATNILIDAYDDRPNSWTTPACRNVGAAAQLLLRGPHA